MRCIVMTQALSPSATPSCGVDVTAAGPEWSSWCLGWDECNVRASDDRRPSRLLLECYKLVVVVVVVVVVVTFKSFGSSTPTMLLPQSYVVCNLVNCIISSIY